MPKSKFSTFWDLVKFFRWCHLQGGTKGVTTKRSWQTRAVTQLLGRKPPTTWNLGRKPSNLKKCILIPRAAAAVDVGRDILLTRKRRRVAMRVRRLRVLVANWATRRQSIACYCGFWRSTYVTWCCRLVIGHGCRRTSRDVTWRTDVGVLSVVAAGVRHVIYGEYITWVSPNLSVMPSAAVRQGL